jgi:orotidine-5'-phosphate decarboxylase
MTAARDRLIVALDQKTRGETDRLVETLGSSVTFYKVGWVSVLTGGLDLIHALRDAGKRVFLDLKIFDVPNTVGEAIDRVAAMGVSFATVHGNRENIEAAVRARGGADLKILAVTVLTSLNENDVRQLYSLPSTVSLAQHAVNVAKRLVELGCDGVITSPNEISLIRGSIPGKTLIVAPGIRLAGETTHDHKRPGTPFESIKAGADYLVVGRSVYQSPDPGGQVEQYVSEIERGLAARE